MKEIYLHSKSRFWNFKYRDGAAEDSKDFPQRGHDICVQILFTILYFYCTYLYSRPTFLFRI